MLQKNAGRLLGRQEVQNLIDHCAKIAPKMLDDVVPKIITVATFQKILASLLDEGVHIRDMRTVIEALAEHAPRTTDPSELTACVRVALGPAIMQTLYGAADEMQVIVVEPELERVLGQALGTTADSMALEPSLAEGLLRGATAAAARQESIGQPPALLVPDRLRIPLARLLRRTVPELRVIAHSEIPESRSIRVSSILGANAIPQTT